MGQRVKGGRWCPQCQRTVMGVKNTHPLRNAAGVGGVMATGGLSLLALRSERYICPHCGSHLTRPAAPAADPELAAWRRDREAVVRAERAKVRAQARAERGVARQHAAEERTQRRETQRAARQDAANARAERGAERRAAATLRSKGRRDHAREQRRQAGGVREAWRRGRQAQTSTPREEAQEVR